MKKSVSGFTIVELLIVIVVIAILATISVVAYSGMQKRASQTAILSEVNQWKKLFEAYRAINGIYPLPVPSGDPMTSGGPGSSAQNRYCLGTGFPQSGGVSYCSVVSSSNVWRAEEATGAHLLSQLSTVGTPPINSKKYIYDNVTGPLLIYNGGNSILIATFPAGTDCASLGMLTSYGDATRQDCSYPLDYSS